jgi:hypothetical protein
MSEAREVALLKILIATREKALEAFHASDHPLDTEFVADLDRVIIRSRGELAALTGSDPA